MNKFLYYFKIIFINLFIFFSFIIILELFFGFWFKNDFALRLSGERNLDRVYKFNFENHKGFSHYKKNNYAFRVNKTETNINEVDIVFAGGSTTNQKFIKYEDTIVSNLQNELNINIINAGIDGMSIIGHINSFKFWFNKIKNFKPKYYIFFLGTNDLSNIQKKKSNKSIDQLLESSKKESLREYFESNSFIYTKLRKLTSYLFFKYKNEIFSNRVNKRTKVYGQRDKKDFITYNMFLKKMKFERKIDLSYIKYLEKLTSLVRQNNSKIIYITQVTGTGVDINSFVIVNSIIKHCDDFKLNCINLAEFGNLNYEDFYDWAHLTPNGSNKAAKFIALKLKNIINTD